VSEEADWIEQVICDYSPSSCYQLTPPVSTGGAEGKLSLPPSISPSANTLHPTVDLFIHTAPAIDSGRTDAPFPALLSNLPSQTPSEMPTRESTMFDSQGSSGNSTVVEIKPPSYEESPHPLKGAESGNTNIFQSFESFDQITKIVIICGSVLVIITATAAVIAKTNCSSRKRSCL
jgi:hypothetical protein